LAIYHYATAEGLEPLTLEFMLACWTADLCIVPFNARLHPREVTHIVSNSGARLRQIRLRSRRLFPCLIR
jgi:hypothetical protein